MIYLTHFEKITFMGPPLNSSFNTTVNPTKYVVRQIVKILPPLVSDGNRRYKVSVIKALIE